MVQLEIGWVEATQVWEALWKDIIYEMKLENQNEPAMQGAGERAFQTEGIARAKGLGSKQAYLKTKRKKLDRENGRT